MTSTTRIRRSNDARVRSQEGWDGEERVRSPRGKREEGREKREGRMNPVDDSTHGIEDMHDQDEKVE